MNRRLLFIILAAAVTYGANFWGTSIYILDESRNASCAMEMLTHNEFIVPTFNGELRTDKPPLHYYFMMASYSLFGVTPFAARLFSVICGIITVLVVFLYTRRKLNERSATWTAVVLLSSLQLTIQFHLAVPDPYLILLMTCSLLALFEGIQHENLQAMCLFYTFAALAFLTKGLIAIIFPGLITLVFLAIQKKLKSLFNLIHLFPGALIFLVIALPWYILVGVRTNGAWLRGFFLEHNFERYTSSMEGHSGFPLAAFVIIITALLPFSVFIVQALRLSWLSRKQVPFLYFCLIAVAVITIFFSFSKTILPSYPAPALPLLAIILGYYLSNSISLESILSFKSKGTIVSFILLLLITIAVPLSVFFGIGFDGQLIQLQWTAWLFLPLPILTIAAIARYNSNRRQSFGLLAAGWIITSLTFFYVAYPLVDRQTPSQLSKNIIADSTHVVAYGSLNPAYVFQLKKEIPVLTKPNELIHYMIEHPDAVVITSKTFLEKNTPGKGFRQIFVQQDLFESSTTVLLKRK